MYNSYVQFIEEFPNYSHKEHFFKKMHVYAMIQPILLIIIIIILQKHEGLIPELYLDQSY